MYWCIFYCVLFIAYVQVISIEIPESIFDKPILNCIEKTNVDKLFLENSFDDNFHIQKNTKVNEFLECVGKYKSFVKEDGTLNQVQIHDHTVNVLIPLMNKSGDKHEIATKVTNECIDVSSDSYGDRIANLHNCLVDALAKN